MKTTILIFLLQFLFSSSVILNAQQIEWTKHYEQDSSITIWPNEILLFEDNLLIGTTNSLKSEPSKFFQSIYNLDTSGNIIWNAFNYKDTALFPGYLFTKDETITQFSWQPLVWTLFTNAVYFLVTESFDRQGEKVYSSTNYKDTILTLDSWVYGKFGDNHLSAYESKSLSNGRNLRIYFTEYNDKGNAIDTVSRSLSFVPDHLIIDFNGYKENQSGFHIFGRLMNEDKDFNSQGIILNFNENKELINYIIDSTYESTSIRELVIANDTLISIAFNKITDSEITFNLKVCLSDGTLINTVELFDDAFFKKIYKLKKIDNSYFVLGSEEVVENVNFVSSNNFIMKLNSNFEIEYKFNFMDDDTRRKNAMDIIKKGDDYFIAGSYDTTMYLAKFVEEPDNVGSFDANFPNIIAFPNPVAETFSLELSDDFSGTCEIRLVDLAGRTVKDYGNVPVSAGSLNLSAAGIAPGLYFLRVRNKNQFKAVKIIKM